jgi:hypothetical protein
MNWTWAILKVGVLTDGEKAGLEVAAQSYGTNQRVATLRRNTDNSKVVAYVPNPLLPAIPARAIVSMTADDAVIRAAMEQEEWQVMESEE